jgi:hypothetical protein
VSVIINSGEMDPAQRQMLQALMDVSTPDRDRLEFLG